MPALGTHPTAGGVLFALQGKDGTIPTAAPLRRDDTNTYDVLSVGGAAIDSGSILFALNSAVRIAANPVAAQYPRTIAGVFNVSAIGGSLMSLSWDDNSYVEIQSNSGQVRALIRENSDVVATDHPAQMTIGSWVAVAFTELSATSRTLRVGAAKIVGPTTSITTTGSSALWLTAGGLTRDAGALNAPLPAGSRATNIALWGAGHPNASMDDETWAAILANPDIIYTSGGPVITGPTVVSTGNTIATVRVTTDTAPTGSSILAVQVLPAATAAPLSAAILASPTQTITSGASGARDFNLTGLTNGTAVRAHATQTGGNVVSTDAFTPVAIPALSAPTRSTPTGTSAIVGFTTDIGSGEARAVLVAATSVPTTPSAAQVKAGQNASGSTSGVVAPSPLAITSTGIKTFAGATVTAGLTYYGFIVHTAAGVDSAVLATGPLYPGTGRPVSDIAANGYTPSAGGNLSAMLNENTADDATFITSPALTGSFVGGPVLALSQAYGAGTYSNVRIRKWVASGSGEFRIDFLNDSGTVVGSTASQAMNTTPTTYTLPVTLTGTATRVQLFERTV